MHIILWRSISMILILIYTIVGIGACSLQTTMPSSTAEAPVAEQTAEKQTLTILSSRGGIGLVLQQAAEMYMASNPGVHISVQTIGNETDYRLALRSRLLSGEQADLFHVLGRRDAAELSAHLKDLSHLEWAAAALPGTLDEVTFDGALCGIPYAVEGYGLIANRNIFEAVGIPLAGITTFADLEEAFAGLKEQIIGGDLEERFPNLEAVTELPAQDRSYLGSQIAGLLFSADFASAAQAAESKSLPFLQEEQGEKYLRLLARYSANGLNFSNRNLVTESRQVETGLATERVAVIQQSVEIYRNVCKLNPELDGRLALLPIPLGEDGGSILTEVPAWWAVNTGATDSAQALAEDFLYWLYHSEAGTALVANRFGAVSPYRDTAKDTGVSLHSQMLDYIERQKTRPNLYREFPQGWGGDIFAVQLQRYFDSEISWSGLADACRDEWLRLRR